MTKRIISITDTLPTGLRFLTESGNKTKIELIIKRLERCSEAWADYSGKDECKDCKYFKRCRNAYDDRCEINEIPCPKCRQTVPSATFCAECGARIGKYKIRSISP